MFGVRLVFKVRVKKSFMEEEIRRWGRKARISSDEDHGDVLGYRRRCSIDGSVKRRLEDGLAWPFGVRRRNHINSTGLFRELAKRYFW